MGYSAASRKLPGDRLEQPRPRSKEIVLARAAIGGDRGSTEFRCVAGAPTNPRRPLPWTGKIGGIAYAPYQRSQSPIRAIYPSVDEIDRDLKTARRNTPDRIRILLGAGKSGHPPELAQPYHLKVLAGTYLDHRQQRNEDELARAESNRRRS